MGVFLAVLVISPSSANKLGCWIFEHRLLEFILSMMWLLHPINKKHPQVTFIIKLLQCTAFYIGITECAFAWLKIYIFSSQIYRQVFYWHFQVQNYCTSGMWTHVSVPWRSCTRQVNNVYASSVLRNPLGRKPWFRDGVDYYYFLNKQQISSIQACLLPVSKTGEKGEHVLLVTELGRPGMLNVFPTLCKLGADAIAAKSAMALSSQMAFNKSQSGKKGDRREKM